MTETKKALTPRRVSGLPANPLAALHTLLGWAAFDVRADPADTTWTPAEVVQLIADLSARSVLGATPAEHRFEGESEPVAENPILRGVDLALERLVQRDCFTQRTLRLLEDLRNEVLAASTPIPVNSTQEEK